MDGGEDVKKKKHMGLVVFLGVLIVIIIVLVVGIIIKNNLKEDTDIPIIDEDNAVLVNETIMARLKQDENYSVFEAEKDFDREIEYGSDEKRINTAVYYAYYDYSVFKDLDRAIDILKKVEPLISNEEMRLNYYVALQELCKRDGNEEQRDYYEEKVLEIVPDTVMDLEDNGQ